MSPNPRSLMLAVAMTLLCLTCTGSVNATPFTVVLKNPNQSGTPGQTLTYNGVITNPNQSPGGGPFVLVISPGPGGAFVAPGAFPFPIILPGLGQSTGNIPLFTLMIPASFAGPFPGTAF